MKSGADATMSLLVLPLSDDGTSVNMTISTLVPRFDARLPSRGWLREMPVKVCDIIDVGSAEQLKMLCLDWEQWVSSRPGTKGPPPPFYSPVVHKSNPVSVPVNW